MAKLYKDPVSFEWFEIEDGQEEAARQSGLVPVTEDDKKLAKRIDEFKSKPLPALRVFAAQFADEAAMGLPEAFIDSASNDPFFLEAKERIKEEYDLANTLGGVTGFVASMLYGGPLAKLTTAGASRVATNVVAKTAIAGAAEGAIYGGATSLAEAAGRTYAYFSEGRAFDPEAAAEVFLTEVNQELGDTLASTAVGAGAGASFGLLSRFGEKANKVWSNIKGKGKGKELPNLDFNSASLGETAYIAEVGDDLVYKRLDELSEALASGNNTVADAIKNDIVQRSKGRLNKNATEILDAFKDLDAELIPEALLKEGDALRSYYSEKIAEVAGESGKIKQAQVGTLFRKAQEKLESTFAFGELIDKNPSQLLFEQKTKIADAINDAATEFSNRYDAIKPLWAAQVNGDDFKKLLKEFDSLADEYSFDMKLNPLLNRMKSFLEKKVEERGVVTLEDTQKILRSLSNFYNEAAPSELNRVISRIKRKVDDVIEATAAQNGLEKELLLKKSIDTEYKSFRESLDIIGNKLSDIPSLSNREVLRDALASVTDDELRQSLLGKKGAALRDALSKFGLDSVVHEAARVDLFKRVTSEAVSGEFNIRSLANKIKKISEVDDLQRLFGEERGKLLKSIVTVVDALPSNYTDPRFTSNFNKILRELRDGRSSLGALGDLIADMNLKSVFSTEGVSNILSRAVTKSEVNAANKLIRDIVDFGLERRLPEVKKDFSGIYGMAKTMGKKGRSISKLIGEGFIDAPVDVALLRFYGNEERGKERVKERLDSLKSQKAAISKNLDSIMEELNSIAANTDAFIEGNSLSFFEDSKMDATRMAVTGRIASMLNAIYEVLPKRELLIQEDARNPSVRLTDAERQKIVDSLSAVLNPDVTMAKIITAQATPLEMMAFRSAYPKLSEELVARISSKSGGKLSQKNKIILSYLGARPVDMTVQPHRVANVAKIPMSEEAILAQKEPPVASRSKIKGKFNALATDTLRVETRGGLT